MRLIPVLMLLSVFVLAACASQEGSVNQQPAATPECNFPESFNCPTYYVMDNRIELFMTHGTDSREAVIKDVVVQSDAFSETSPGSGVYHNCSLNDAQKENRFRDGQRYVFILDMSTDNGTCTYRDTGSNENQYAVQIMYSWADEDAVNTIDAEFSAGLSESPPPLFG